MIVLLMGCGSSNQIPLIPVKGKITFGGQQPPANVSITFAALETEDELPRIPGQAVIAADGSYYVRTEQAGNGLIPGRYVANVECWKEEPTMDKPGVSHVPLGFRPAKELVVDSSSSAIVYDIEVPSER